MNDRVRSAADAASGLRPFGAEPQDASQAKPLVPNAGEIAIGLTKAQLGCLKVLSEEFKSPPRGHAYWAGTMLYGHRLTRFRYRDTRTSNKREYALTPLGVAVKRAASFLTASAIEARRAETQGGSVADESAVAKPDAQKEASNGN